MSACQMDKWATRKLGILNIGAGRIVFQDFERINNSIASGEFFKHAALVKALQNLKANNKALHIFGLFSDGGVHSHHDHILAMLEMAAQQGLTKDLCACIFRWPRYSAN